MINAFGNSAEYKSRFDGLSEEALVDNLFQQLFNRSSDPVGLSFYVDLLNASNVSGYNPDLRQSTLAQIALDIANGAQNEDLQTISNKLEVASYFTAQIAAGGISYTSIHIDGARAIPDMVTADMESVPAAIQQADALLNAMAAQDIDRDGHGDDSDNCPQNANSDQSDDDSDGIGNACDPDQQYDLFSALALNSGPSERLYGNKPLGASDWVWYERQVDSVSTALNGQPMLARTYSELYPDSGTEEIWDTDFFDSDENWFYIRGREEIDDTPVGLSFYEPAIQFPRLMNVGQTVHASVVERLPDGSTQPFSLALTLEGTDDIRIRLGSYSNCLRVHFTAPIGAESYDIDWWCPGIGHAKSRSYDAESGRWEVIELLQVQ